MDRSDAIADVIPPREGEFRIQLPTFEGPLDLLLHLIKKHDIDILELPVAFITERYLDYIRLMEELDLDVAAEYLLMAATLTHIKSKMLLPRTPEEQHDDGEVGELVDPRADLIRRLLEYQKYKNAAENLGSRAITGRDVFPRGMAAVEAEGPAPLADIGMFKLLDAFEAILKRTKDRSAFEITSERISIQERMTQISDLLRERGSCLFEELFAKDVSRWEVVITFLALLEMTKMHLTRIYQPEYGASIHVQHALLDASLPTIPPEPVSPEVAEAPQALAEQAPEEALSDDEEAPSDDEEALSDETLRDEALNAVPAGEASADEAPARDEAPADEAIAHAAPSDASLPDAPANADADAATETADAVSPEPIGSDERFDEGDENLP
jgi:segregation and condensation protein A